MLLSSCGSRVIGMMLLISVGATPSQSIASQTAAFRIVVVEGEDAVNVITQKTAVAPVVEVRDRNNLPVAGVPVTFTIAGGKTAAFAGGAQTLSVTTNAAGRAIAAGLNPLTSGAVQINVTAAAQGQVLAATITQTNVLTAAQASAAAAGAGGGTGGLSNTAIAGIAGGAAAAVGVALSAGGEKAVDPPRVELPRVAIDSTPAETGIRDLTEFSFTARDATPTATYSWDFGDGGSAEGTTARHTYTREGTFPVTLRGKNESGEQTATVQIAVGTLGGTWLMSGTDIVFRFVVQQQGSALSGQLIVEPRPGTPYFPDTSPLTGRIDGRTVTLVQGGECRRTLIGDLNRDVTQIAARVTISAPVCGDTGFQWLLVRQ
jgi:PKD repeat protein